MTGEFLKFLYFFPLTLIKLDPFFFLKYGDIFLNQFLNPNLKKPGDIL